MITALVAIKTLFFVVVVLTVGIFAVLVLLSANADSTNREVADLKRRLDALDDRIKDHERRHKGTYNWLRRTDGVIASIQDERDASFNAGYEVGNDFQDASDAVAEVSASLFGLANSLRAAGCRCKGEPVDQLQDDDHDADAVTVGTVEPDAVV